MTDNETRVVDPTTGGEKGSKLARFDLIPPEFERALATHYGVGARKYADRNWEQGYAWGLSVAALRRHLNEWQRGEDLDTETGSPHLIAVAWHAAALYTYWQRDLGTDDVRLPVAPIVPIAPPAAVVKLPTPASSPVDLGCRSGRHLLTRAW